MKSNYFSIHKNKRPKKILMFGKNQAKYYKGFDTGNPDYDVIFLFKDQNGRTGLLCKPV